MANATVFVTGTGTEVGKTAFSMRLARSLRKKGWCAVKPIETGWPSDGADTHTDAVALAEACGDPSLAKREAFYRAEPALGPVSIETEGGFGVNLAAIEKELAQIATQFQGMLIEGAGGVLVPLSSKVLTADWIATLDAKAIIVSKNALGTQSDTIAAYEALKHRNIDVLAVALNDHYADESSATNADVLARWIDAPILRFVDSMRAFEKLIDKIG